jgi:hypothetical protein
MLFYYRFSVPTNKKRHKAKLIMGKKDKKRSEKLLKNINTEVRLTPCSCCEEPRFVTMCKEETTVCANMRNIEKRPPNTFWLEFAPTPV